MREYHYFPDPIMGGMYKEKYDKPIYKLTDNVKNHITNLTQVVSRIQSNPTGALTRNDREVLQNVYNYYTNPNIERELQFFSNTHKKESERFARGKSLGN
jgi:hypothetical protein